MELIKADLKTNQDLLRKELKGFIVKNHHALYQMALDVGISHVSLSRFLNGGDLSIMPLLKIESWVHKQCLHGKGI